MDYHALGLLPPTMHILEGGGLQSPPQSGTLRDRLAVIQGGSVVSEQEQAAQTLPEGVPVGSYHHHQMMLADLRVSMLHHLGRLEKLYGRLGQIPVKQRKVGRQPMPGQVQDKGCAELNVLLGEFKEWRAFVVQETKAFMPGKWRHFDLTCEVSAKPIADEQPNRWQFGAKQHKALSEDMRRARRWVVKEVLRVAAPHDETSEGFPSDEPSKPQKRFG